MADNMSASGLAALESEYQAIVKKGEAALQAAAAKIAELEADAERAWTTPSVAGLVITAACIAFVLGLVL